MARDHVVRPLEDDRRGGSHEQQDRRRGAALRRNQEALLTAADFALRVVPESYRSGTSEQRAVVVLDTGKVG